MDKILAIGHGTSSSKVSGFLGKSKFSSQQWLHVNLGRKHTFECRQTILPSHVTDSLWTVKFDADWQGVET